MCYFIARIEDADSFVANHLRRWPVAVGRDITFGDGPLFSTDVHTLFYGFLRCPRSWLSRMDSKPNCRVTSWRRTYRGKNSIQASCSHPLQPVSVVHPETIMLRWHQIKGRRILRAALNGKTFLPRTLVTGRLS